MRNALEIALTFIIAYLCAGGQVSRAEGLSPLKCGQSILEEKIAPITLKLANRIGEFARLELSADLSSWEKSKLTEHAMVVLSINDRLGSASSWISVRNHMIDKNDMVLVANAIGNDLQGISIAVRLEISGLRQTILKVKSPAFHETLKTEVNNLQELDSVFGAASCRM